MSFLPLLLLLTSTQQLVLGSGDYTRITPMRRQLRDYTPRSSAASLTIALYANEPVTMRWLRYDDARDAEPNIFPIIDDDRYRVSSMRSGDVRASVLTIQNPGEDLMAGRTVKYTLVVDSNRMPLTYMLDTLIPPRTQARQVSPLYGMRWIRAPPPTISYQPSGALWVRCALVQDNHHNDTNSEMVLYKEDIPRSGENHPLGRMPWEVQRMRRNRRFKCEYKKNATVGVEDEGMYTCSMKRTHDRTYVSSWVRRGRVETKPVVSVVDCKSSPPERRAVAVIRLTEKVEGCFRCQATGYPYPQINVYRVRGRTTTRVLSTNDEQVTSYTNVVDGGFSELTVTLRRPTRSNEQYSCVARNAISQDTVNFRVKVGR